MYFKIFLWNFIRFIRCIIYRIFPVNNEAVLFISFRGQYNDNPKYILLELHKLHPNIKIFVAVSPIIRDKIPLYVTPIRYGSLRYYIKFATCAVVVDNTLGVTTPVIFTCLEKFMKKSQQLMIGTWHGTPLKKIGLDDIASRFKQYSYEQILSDYIIAGCKYTSSVLSNSFTKRPYKVSLSGTPRNDILFNSTPMYRNLLKNKLKLPYNKKIVLFAPTFRDCVEQSGISQMHEINIQQILEQCTRKFNGEWVLVFRMHPCILSTMDASSFESQYVIDGNKGDDMAEYLVCTDILITDYSGSMFDFALTGRPCFLFAPDREHYEHKERGFYLDYDSLPFPKAYTNTELLDQIGAFDSDLYKKNIEKFLEDIGNVEDGRASERIAKCIVHFIKTGEKRLETVNGVEIR